MEQLIGRKSEQNILRQIYDEPRAQLVAIYGRRRVGKTYLVKQFFKDRLTFSFTGIFGCNSRDQLKLFTETLSDAWGKKIKLPHDWFEAFHLFKEFLSTLTDERRVVFFDELPWLASRRSKFLSAFSFFWNNWGESQHGLKIIVCGSATSWMVDKLIAPKGGLYGRISQTLHIRPFTLSETEEYLIAKGISWNRYLILQTYMIFGGIPYYLDLLNKELPFTVNIDSLLFASSGRLKLEYDFLFRSLFEESVIYRRTVEELAKKSRGLTLEELKEALDVGDGGHLTNVLVTLIKCEFVRSYHPFGKKKKGCLYQLIDPFCIFHLSFISGRTEPDSEFWSKASMAQRSAWSGYAFERVCLLHIPHIIHALHLDSMVVSVYSWSVKAHTDKDGIRWPGAQIDLIFDRGDHIVDLCEIKFTLDPFIITASYEKTLRERMENFVRTTGTRSATRLVFITNEGVRENIHSGIVQGNITANDLFCDFKSIMQ